jgi:predicted dehydrogenase
MSTTSESGPRVVVVGTGQIGAVHVECARRAGARVVGVLGSSIDRAQPKARAWGIDKVYSGIDELLDDKDVDVVHVASPNHLHAEQAIAVAQAGKHVVCEKPLALNANSALHMVEAAESAGVVNATCFNFRFYPLMHEAHAMRLNGELGTPRFLTGSYHQDWLFEETDWNWRLDASRAGDLRAVADIGSHWLDLLSWISGSRVAAVCADLHTFLPTRYRPDGEVETFSGASTSKGVPVQINTDDAASVLLRLQDGARGSFSVSQISAGRKNDLRFELAGSRRALMWSSEASDTLWIGRRGRTSEVLLKDPVHLSEQARSVAFYPGGHVEGYAEAFTALFAAVYTDVARGVPCQSPTYPTFVDGYLGACVADAIRTSAHMGQWTAVEYER